MLSRIVQRQGLAGFDLAASVADGFAVDGDQTFGDQAFGLAT